MLRLVFPDENVIVLYLFLRLYRSNVFNPLSANIDQHQFSPNNIHMLSRD